MSRRSRGVRLTGAFAFLVLSCAAGLVALSYLPRPTELRTAPDGTLLRFSAEVRPLDGERVALFPAGTSTTSSPRFLGTVDRDQTALLEGPSHRDDLAGRVVSTSSQSVVLDLVDLHVRPLSYVALLLLLMGIVLVYDGRRSLSELSGERIVLESTSRFRHVIEYGVIATAAGASFLADEIVRRSGVRLPWRPVWGTILFLAVPAVLLSFYFLVPWLSAWVGLGPRGRPGPSSRA